MNQNIWIDAIGGISDKYIQDALELRQRKKAPMSRMKKVFLIAAVLAALLATAAMAVRLVLVRFEESSMQIADSDWPLLEFVHAEDTPARLGVWDIGEVPEGYIKVTKEVDPYNYSKIYTNEGWFIYRNDEGQQIYLSFTHGMQAMFSSPEMITERKTISVNGNPGTLYIFQDGRQVLFWVNEARGIGFELSCTDFDAVELAKTVVEVAYKPEPDDLAIEALESLGDWFPASLPEGYEEYHTEGVPPEHGYGYVRRTYMNEEYWRINLDYEETEAVSVENYVGDYRDRSEMSEAEALELYGHTYRVTDLTVGGADAALVEYTDGTPVKLIWQDSSSGLIFQLYADKLTSEELIALAESVTLAK